MRSNTEDKTIERSYQRKWRFLIGEYEETKAKKHPRYRFVTDFYKVHHISRQTFCKYYNRYRNSGGIISSVLPEKRGPRWKTRRSDLNIEKAVLEFRQRGMNRYEISQVLRSRFYDKTPSPSGVYKILRRYQVNRLTRPMKQEKRQIIKQRAGELGHFDCHYLPKDLIVNDSHRYYLVCVMDDFSRIAWAEVVRDIQSLTVMFTALKAINVLKTQYHIQFEEVITDNGSEFSNRSPQSFHQHPFERMLMELGIKHRYTRPYRPQTNGKVERFWKTLNEDLIEESVFESFEQFEKELFEYLIYYNEHRPHSAINNIPPKQFLKQNCQRIA